jgi:hypothetical protein
MSTLRVDIKEPPMSLVSRLEAATLGIEGVRFIISDEDEYRLSGREVAKFVAISMLAGVIGNSAYTGTEALLHKVITIIGEEAEKTKKPIGIVVDGIQFEIGGAEEAASLERQLITEFKISK